jgi:hypothetical protein
MFNLVEVGFAAIQHRYGFVPGLDKLLDNSSFKFVQR